MLRKLGLKFGSSPSQWMGPLALTPSLLHSDLVYETMSNCIRSVSFSPDSKLLATGTWDGVVQVSSRIFMSTIVITIIVFEANAQHGMISIVLDLGHCREANLQHIPGSQRDD